MKALNLKTGECLATKVVVADTVFSRMKGLLGRDMLPRSEALWIKPCKAVHTIWMKFPIDILFLARDHTVVAAEEHVPPNRFSAFVLRAESVMELPAGTIRLTGTRAGDTIRVS